MRTLYLNETASMKKAILIHNPTAGSGDHNKKDLQKEAQKWGYTIDYYSTVALWWERFVHKEPDLFFVAGGDGTVQKFISEILGAKNDSLEQVPIQILPYGTANNIAKTLGINDPEEVLRATTNSIKFDIGKVKGIPDSIFFIEGIGCGIFPRLVLNMKSKDEDEKQDEIEQSLKELLKIIDTYQAREAIVIADKEEITGRFLLLELMNIRYIGPNIELAPGAETGDGRFELVIVREEARNELRSYIQDHLDHKISPSQLADFAELRKVEEVRMKWKGEDLHVDDKIIEKYKGEDRKSVV